MSGTLQALLAAVLGAVLGGGVVLAWRSSHVAAPPPPADADAGLPGGVSRLLAALRSSALVVDSSDRVLKASTPAMVMGLVRDSKIAVPELARLVSEVRRDGVSRDAELVVARASGLTPRTVVARITQLNSKLVLALVEDRTRERRVESIRRDFVVNVSHELKTPVGAIKLLADAVTDAADDPDAVQRFAARMQLESDRLSRLVQQIIELSRLQDDDPLDQPAEFDIDMLIERSIDTNGMDAANRNITVVHDGQRGLSTVGNPDQIALALNNLLANALKYSPDGSAIVVSARETGKHVEVAVTDQGIGIPAAEIDRIFERFYRVDPARHRSTGGSGLGLSIVKHVMAAHGGDVRVWSSEGQGSTFTLALPKAGRETQREVAVKEGQ